jgi:hypothetical protein
LEQDHRPSPPAGLNASEPRANDPTQEAVDRFVSFDLVHRPLSEQRNCYVNVLRDAMAVDSLDACGVYFGTTGGQVYASADAGDSWEPIVRDLPAVLSVEVQTLP